MLFKRLRESLFARYFINRFSEFSPHLEIWVTWDKDKPIKFWDQKIESQGHNKIKYGQKFTFGAILSP